MVTWEQIVIPVGAAAAAIAAHLLLYHLSLFVARKTPWGFDDDLVACLRWPTFILFPTITLLILFSYLGLQPDIRLSLVRAFAVMVTTGVAFFIMQLVKFIGITLIKANNVEVENNLNARIAHTQVQVFKRICYGFIVLVWAACVVSIFPTAWQIGASLLASAGVFGLIVGFAAKPIFENAISSMIIAITRPVLLDDEIVVDGEYGRVESISSMFIIQRTWDSRRIIVPLTRLLSQPFENLSRRSTWRIGTVTLTFSPFTPIPLLRAYFHSTVLPSAGALWDGKVANCAVTDSTPEGNITVRFIMSAKNSSNSFDLRCHVREKVVEIVAERWPECLVSRRMDVGMWERKRKKGAVRRVKEAAGEESAKDGEEGYGSAHGTDEIEDWRDVTQVPQEELWIFESSATLDEEGKEICSVPKGESLVDVEGAVSPAEVPIPIGEMKSRKASLATAAEDMAKFRRPSMVAGVEVEPVKFRKSEFLSQIGGDIEKFRELQSQESFAQQQQNPVRARHELLPKSGTLMSLFKHRTKRPSAVSGISLTDVQAVADTVPPLPTSTQPPPPTRHESIAVPPPFSSQPSTSPTHASSSEPTAPSTTAPQPPQSQQPPTATPHPEHPIHVPPFFHHSTPSSSNFPSRRPTMASMARLDTFHSGRRMTMGRVVAPPPPNLRRLSETEDPNQKSLMDGMAKGSMG
ncbi:hypothetical protein HK097_001470 [Rhizophlyctis rosea]|uniref:Mechanosensitive ion channel MscS domain-containing protein n=1 Tax=Rhizophlyctis rosea TaxID=64517 RepID=A0AAD5S6L5_9FUNG|nr:hypothetical protein HK097_001470 [Rhizophlyctis rosea]